MTIWSSTRPLDWRERTSGRTVYAADLIDKRPLQAAVLRSPHPHARIVALDTSIAQTMPGVHAVITMLDFGADVRYHIRGGITSDWPPLATDTVRYVGQEVAAVAAETRQQAEAACRAIRVRYRRLRAPLTIDAAMARRAGRLHERGGAERNVAQRLRGQWGDPALGESRSSVRLAGRYVYPSVSHACMEPNTTLASWDTGAQRMELWTSTQSPYFVSKEVAHVLGLAPHQVVCREVAVGGGFGSKSKISSHEAIAACLSRKAGAPVLLALTREEEFGTNKTRHRFETTLTLSADDSGRLLAMDARVLVDNGAYCHVGPAVMRAGIAKFGTMYRPLGLRFDARLVDTANQPGGAFRGYGGPQATFALESLIDEVAEELGVDPIEFRLRNIAAPNTTALSGRRITTTRLGDCLEAVRRELDWDEKKRSKVPGRGLGVAAGVHGSGSYSYESANRSDAAIDVLDDGRVRVRFGGADTGTGQRTILAQVAAHELGTAAEDVEVVTMDSETTPFDMGAWSSRGTHMSASAVGLVARQMAETLTRLAAEKLGSENITLAGGRAFTETGEVTFGDLVRFSPETVDGALTREASYVVEGTEMLSAQKDTGNLSPTYAFAAHGAEVEVNTRTGQVRLLDYVAAHDVGAALNPTLVEGQILGGSAMGIGGALGEEVIREGGRVVNPAYVNYALPRAADVPRLRAVIVANTDPHGPYGAKSVGEMSINPAGATIANAVFDAVGVRVRELPITPDKILNALAEKERRRRSFGLWRRPNRWWVALLRGLYPLGVHHVLDRWGTRLGPEPSAARFEKLIDAHTVSEALAATAGGAKPLGGGTDVLVQQRQGICGATEGVFVSGVEEMTRCSISPEGDLRIGAAMTLSQVETELADELPALAGAVRTIASPQIRNTATLAGNLLQEKRCWFFRNDFPCYKRAGAASPCYAIRGDHRFHHAVIGGHRCQAVTPSDLASVLVAYDAQVVIARADERRTVPMDDFYTGPAETVLRDDELVVQIVIPSAARTRACVFEKLALGKGDFAMASVALSVQPGERGAWTDVRMVLGGAAPAPWRPRRLERRLDGARPEPAELRRLLDAELNRAAHPLPGNTWKLDALSGLAMTAAERLNER